MNAGSMDDDLARLGHLNFAECCRESARWGRGGVNEDSDGVLLFATGSWLPVLGNGIVRIDDHVDAEDVLARAASFFAALGRGYTVVVRDLSADDDLRAACGRTGLAQFGEPTPEMSCAGRLDDRAAPEGVILRWVASDADVADFVAVNAAAYATYGMPSDVVSDTFSRPDRLLASPHVRSVVAYADGAPIAAAQTIASHGIACVFWVGTVPEGRGRGAGEAVTRAVTNAGFDLGARASTLQASTMGEPIYRRMGYETLYHYHNYVRFTKPR